MEEAESGMLVRPVKDAAERLDDAVEEPRNTAIVLTQGEAPKVYDHFTLDQLTNIRAAGLGVNTALMQLYVDEAAKAAAQYEPITRTLGLEGNVSLSVGEPEKQTAKMFYRVCNSFENCSMAGTQTVLREGAKYCFNCGHETEIVRVAEDGAVTIVQEKVVEKNNEGNQTLEEKAEAAPERQVVKIGNHKSPVDYWRGRGEETSSILAEFYRENRAVIIDKNFPLKWKSYPYKEDKETVIVQTRPVREQIFLVRSRFEYGGPWLEFFLDEYGIAITTDDWQKENLVAPRRPGIFSYFGSSASAKRSVEDYQKSLRDYEKKLAVNGKFTLPEAWARLAHDVDNRIYLINQDNDLRSIPDQIAQLIKDQNYSVVQPSEGK